MLAYNFDGMNYVKWKLKNRDYYWVRLKFKLALFYNKNFLLSCYGELLMSEPTLTIETILAAFNWELHIMMT